MAAILLSIDSRTELNTVYRAESGTGSLPPPRGSTSSPRALAYSIDGGAATHATWIACSQSMCVYHGVSGTLLRQIVRSARGWFLKKKLFFLYEKKREGGRTRRYISVLASALAPPFSSHQPPEHFVGSSTYLGKKKKGRGAL